MNLSEVLQSKKPFRRKDHEIRYAEYKRIPWFYGFNQCTDGIELRDYHKKGYTLLTVEDLYADDWIVKQE